MDAPNLDALRTKEYWNSRYEDEPQDYEFDWFKNFDELSVVLKELLKIDDRILMLGCGNSSLSPRLYEIGYKNIQNVDFSEALIRKMSAKYSSMKEMTWEIMDVRCLDVPSASVDIAIDKGTMDALLCSTGSVWSPSEEIVQSVTKEVDEVLRVLKPGGRFLYISFGQPHFRLPYLNRDDWSEGVKVDILGEGGLLQYFFYQMEKRRDESM